jgi:hypothetical protein
MHFADSALVSGRTGFGESQGDPMYVALTQERQNSTPSISSSVVSSSSTDDFPAPGAPVNRTAHVITRGHDSQPALDCTRRSTRSHGHPPPTSRQLHQPSLPTRGLRPAATLLNCPQCARLPDLLPLLIYDVGGG